MLENLGIAPHWPYGIKPAAYMNKQVVYVNAYGLGWGFGFIFPPVLIKY
jgi:hypothetical protein